MNNNSIWMESNECKDELMDILSSSMPENSNGALPFIELYYESFENVSDIETNIGRVELSLISAVTSQLLEKYRDETIPHDEYNPEYIISCWDALFDDNKNPINYFMKHLNHPLGDITGGIIGNLIRNGVADPKRDEFLFDTELFIYDKKNFSDSDSKIAQKIVNKYVELGYLTKDNEGSLYFD